MTSYRIVKNEKFRLSVNGTDSDHLGYVNGSQNNGGDIGEVEMELIHFDEYITSTKVLKKLNKIGYRPAVTQELRAFKEKYPKIQCGFSVVALGSTELGVTGKKYYLYIDSEGLSRKGQLTSNKIKSCWDKNCLFLVVVVRKKPEK